MRDNKIEMTVQYKNPANKNTKKEEFATFAADQFKQLLRRNLGVPFKLYHL